MDGVGTREEKKQRHNSNTQTVRVRFLWDERRSGSLEN